MGLNTQTHDHRTKIDLFDVKNYTVKNLTSKILILIILLLGACTGSSHMTGKERSQRDQKYYNYEAAMKRTEKARKQAAREAKKTRKKNE